MHGLEWMRKLEPRAAFSTAQVFSHVVCDCMIYALFLL